MRAARLALLAMLVAHHAVAFAALGIDRVDGRWRVLLDDDMMVSLRYARNLAAGHGPVFNVGERVEGFSNPLSTALSAAVHLLPAGAAVAPLFLDLLSLAASVWILLQLLAPTAPAQERPWRGLVSAAVYALGAQHLFFAHAGYEVYLQSALLLYGCTPRARADWRHALLVGVAPLTHPTALVGWAVLLAAAALQRSAVRQRAAVVAAMLAPVAAYQLFRAGYYGEVVPNTFYLKAVGASPFRAWYFGNWLPLAAPAVVLALIAAARHLRRPGPDAARTLLPVAVAAAQALAVIAVGGDYVPEGRFLFVTFVLCAAVSGEGAAVVHTLAARGSPRAAAPALAVVLALAPAALIVNVARKAALLHERKLWNVRHLALGLAIRANTPPDARLALFHIGYAGYFGERPIVDMLGKIDPRIARTPGHAQRVPGHNKSSPDAVLATRPDLVELKWYPPHEIRDLERLAYRAATHPHGYYDELGMHPVFRDVYLPNPIVDGRGRPLALHARGDIPAAARRWRVSDDAFRFARKADRFE